MKAKVEALEAQIEEIKEKQSVVNGKLKYV